LTSFYAFSTGNGFANVLPAMEMHTYLSKWHISAFAASQIGAILFLFG
jgi:hypothetical protein